MLIRIAHLYPKLMNTYGDTGNIICLQKRLTWRAIDVEIVPVEIGEEIPDNIQLYFMGGGQDNAQALVGNDLLRHRERLTNDLLIKDIPALVICGGYQLFGIQYIPFDDDPIPGIGIIPVETSASKQRMIGNIIVSTDICNEEPTLVGFENHSGKTYIIDNKDAQPLGKVVKGYGNNGTDQTEGCIIKNTIGTYLHGSLLPKNPHLADWLIEKACNLTDSSYPITPLDDDIEWQAHNYIKRSVA